MQGGARAIVAADLHGVTARLRSLLGPLCGDLTQNGGRDEWVDVADYRRGVAVIAALIGLWCGVEEA